MPGSVTRAPNPFIVLRPASKITAPSAYILSAALPPAFARADYRLRPCPCNVPRQASSGETRYRAGSSAGIPAEYATGLAEFHSSPGQLYRATVICMDDQPNSRSGSKRAVHDDGSWAPLAWFGRLPGRLVPTGDEFSAADLFGPASRIYWMKALVACGLILGLLLSPRLWAGARFFPPAPVLDVIPPVPFPLDWIVLFALLAVLAATILSPRPRPFIWAIVAIVCLLAFSIRPGFSHGFTSMPSCWPRSGCSHGGWTTSSAGTQRSMFAGLRWLVSISGAVRRRRTQNSSTMSFPGCSGRFRNCSRNPPSRCLICSECSSPPSRWRSELVC